jgi:hypothetical protein
VGARFPGKPKRRRIDLTSCGEILTLNGFFKILLHVFTMSARHVDGTRAHFNAHIRRERAGNVSVPPVGRRFVDQLAHSAHSSSVTPESLP